MYKQDTATLKQTVSYLHRIATAIFGPVSWKNLSLKLRLMYWVQGVLNYKSIARMLGSGRSRNLQHILVLDPHFLGVLIWPLVDARWSAKRRLQELCRHYKEIDVVGNVFSLQLEETRTLLAFDGELSNLRLCIEWQSFFRREGQLALSLFNGMDRVFSVAFLLSEINGKRVAYIGAVQGVKQSDDSDLYKNITKAAHGLRPRDLIISMFLALCDAIDVTEVFAVRDANRQHRHAYFGRSGGSEVIADYDAIWSEHEAVLNSEGFFALMPGVRVRDLETIASKKRSMYRKRYDFLNQSLSSLRKIVKSSV
jgi:uncharacterized protein